jgi:8-oxo-dGTP pyrophosphatase MutT (NUDIX family)
MAQSGQLAVALRRPAYRLAYALLRLYWFIARPSVLGVKCVLTDGDRVLLVRHTYGAAEWVLPGGAVKRGEHPLAAARREMHEELGVAVENWTPLGVLTGRLHHRRDTIHCFHAELGDPVLDLDRGEIAAAGWFPRDSLPADLGGYVRPILAWTSRGKGSDE